MTLKKRQINIRTKLFFVSSLFLIVPVLVLGILGNIKISNTLEEAGMIRLQNSVEMTLEMIEAFNNEVEGGNVSLASAQDKVVAAILGAQNDDGTREMKENINLGEYGYLYIMDQNGTVLGSVESARGENFWSAEDEAGNLYIQEVISVGNSGGGVTYYEWPLPDSSGVETKINYAKTDPYWGWVVSASTYMSDFNAAATEYLNFTIIIIVAAVVIGSVIVWFFSSRISNPIVQVSNSMDQLAQFDLSGADVIVKSDDEVGRLARSLNEMKHRLQGIIGKLTDATTTVSSHSEELTQSANEVLAGSEQIAGTMEDLASGAETEADHAATLSSLMEDFSGKVQEANANGEQIQANSTQVLSLTDRGSELMESSAAQMEKIDHIVQEAVVKVSGFDQYAKKISELVFVIKDISEQTNLLSLNAQIEAARAGEHGRGFAVVADEVRKLADQSADSVTHITEIVRSIQSESSSVSTSLQESYKEVEEGTSQIHMTKETFGEISESINDMATRIQLITQNLVEMSTGSQKMNGSIQEIAAISEQSAAGIEQTSASSQQTSSSMHEVTASANELSKLAEQLNELIHQFKL